MITTRIVEMFANNIGGIEEKVLGWTQLPSLPVEPKPVNRARAGEEPPQPMVVKVNGANHFVIGHSWDIETSGTPGQGESVLILIVQKVAVAPTLVKAPASTLQQLGAAGGLGRKN